jgi:hypothetical protein
VETCGAREKINIKHTLDEIVKIALESALVISFEEVC